MSEPVVSERSSARFGPLLALIAFVGFVLRAVYVAIASGSVGGDGRYYHAIAALLADGKGFIAPSAYLATGKVVASAPHPPAWPLTLAAAALVGLRTTLEQQLVACVIGTATVVIVG